MKTKITTLSAAILVGISSMASANPPSAPAIYATGPAAPILNMTDMRDTERAAFALGEAMLQATESVVYVKGCQEFTTDVEIYSHPDSNTHFIRDESFGGVRLDALLQPQIPGFGQHIDVSQATQGILNTSPVQAVRGRYTYSSKNNLMVNEKTGIQVKGQNRAFDQFYSTVIKDFYHGNTFDTNGEFYEINDYGLQSLSKFGYPVNKWWQKSKFVRDDGQQGCTVFQKDRLVGAGSCRITLSTVGYSQPGLYWQNGTLSVTRVNPSAPEPEINNCGVNPIFEPL